VVGGGVGGGGGGGGGGHVALDLSPPLCYWFP